MSHVQFCHHCLMAAFQQLHHLLPAQEEVHQEGMAGVVTLVSVVVEEEDGMTTEDPAEVSHQENGGEVKHHQSVSLVMGEEEEEAVLADQMAVGMEEAGAVGDSSGHARRSIMGTSIASSCSILFNKQKVERTVPHHFD